MDVELGHQTLKEKGNFITKRKLGLPPDTVLAYQVKELEIVEDGK